MPINSNLNYYYLNDRKEQDLYSYAEKIRQIDLLEKEKIKQHQRQLEQALNQLPYVQNQTFQQKQIQLPATVDQLVERIKKLSDYILKELVEIEKEVKKVKDASLA